MEKKEIKISLSTLIIAVIALILLVAVVIMGMHIANQNKALEASQLAMANKEKEIQEKNVIRNNDKTYTNTKNDTNTDNEKTKQIVQFLASGKIISTANCVGAGDPDMYYFTSDGNFAYRSDHYFTKEGQTISAVGTWEVKDNKLVLTIQQEKKVKGGKMVKAEASDPCDHLENYTEEMSKSTYIKKYEINDFIKDEDKTYNTYDNNYYLKLDEMELFQLNIYEDEAVEEVKNLAVNGSY